MGLTEQQIKLLRYYIQHDVLSYDIVPSDYDRLEDLGLIEKRILHGIKRTLALVNHYLLTTRLPTRAKNGLRGMTSN